MEITAGFFISRCFWRRWGKEELKKVDVKFSGEVEGRATSVQVSCCDGGSSSAEDGL
jgi:hypothetical protein